MRRDHLVAAVLLAGFAKAAAAQTTEPQANPQPAQTTPATPAAAPEASPATPPAAHSAARKPGTAAPRRKQAEEGPEANMSDEPDIIVQGTRNLPGAVVGDIPPEEQLGPADIRSYGVSSVSELLNELAPQTYSGRGSGAAPVVLLNGKRISGFQEIRDLPTEAIARVDILPEEVALKYGYSADQRVVNIVLRRRFRAETAQFSDQFATAGGRNTPDAEGNLLRIRGDNRLTLHLGYTSSDPLTEAQRGIVQQPSNYALPGNIVGLTRGAEIDPTLSALAGGTVTIAGVPAGAATAAPTLDDFVATAGQPNVTQIGNDRTLLASNQDVNANIVFARPLGSAQATVNATIEYSRGVALQGLPTVALGLPGGNPFSPFGSDVVVDRYYDGFGPIRQRTTNLTAHLGTTVNGNISSGWRYSITGTFDRAEDETLTDAGIDATAFQALLDAGDPGANPFAPFTPGVLARLPQNRAHSVSTAGQVDALFNGSLFSLPAGKVSTAVHVGGQITDFSSQSYRNGVTTDGDVGRNIANGQLNIDVPIASRSKHVLSAIGDLSVNFNIAGNYLSDFNTLRTIGYGFNWQPVKGVRLIGSATDRDRAPTPQQLGNPSVTTPNVRIFDYVTGTTATVTTVSGGNGNLLASSTHVKKLGLTVNPFTKTDFTFTANYITEHDDNPITSFPAATAAIEAAFPTRFTRDSQGNLTRIDTRPINFASSDREEFRWGFNISFRMKSKLQKEIEAWRAGKGPNPFEGLPIPGFMRRQGFNPGGEGGPGGGQGGGQPGGGQGNGQPGNGDQQGGDSGAGARPGGSAGTAGAGSGRPGGGGFGGGGFRGGGRGGGFGGGGAAQAGGRLQFAVYHTWHLTDRVLVEQGGPSFDLLNGDTVDNSGGQARHQVDVQAGYNNNGLGARISATWKSGTEVFAGTAGAPQTLNFGDIGTVNLRLFADLGQRLDLVKAHPWVRGMRLSLNINNLFDSHQRVTDQTGAVPLSYQAGYVDPLGRTISFQIRKLFL